MAIVSVSHRIIRHRSDKRAMEAVFVRSPTKMAVLRVREGVEPLVRVMSREFPEKVAELPIGGRYATECAGFDEGYGSDTRGLWCS